MAWRDMRGKNPKPAAFDLEGPLEDVPSGYLMTVLIRQWAKNDILGRVAREMVARRVAGEVRLSNLVEQRIRMILGGLCVVCHRKRGIYIVGRRLFCSEHRHSAMQARAAVTKQLEQRAAEKSRFYGDIERGMKIGDRAARFDTSKRAHGGRSGLKRV